MRLSNNSCCPQSSNDKTMNLIINNMKTFLKYLGAILVLCGVVCLAIYAFVKQTNVLLVVAMALEVVGILSYIIINKRVE